MKILLVQVGHVAGGLVKLTAQPILYKRILDNFDELNDYSGDTRVFKKRRSASTAARRRSKVKHEYLGGDVYALAGARNAHNLIATNTVGTLYLRLRGQRCRAYNSDTKIRIRRPTPDSVLLSGRLRDLPPQSARGFLSRRARRLGRGVVAGNAAHRCRGKKDAYLTIPSLFVYLLIEQATPTVAVFRRTEQGFVREAYQGLEAVVPLPEIGIDLPLVEIYDGSDFVPESVEEA